MLSPYKKISTPYKIHQLLNIKNLKHILAIMEKITTHSYAVFDFLFITYLYVYLYYKKSFLLYLAILFAICHFHFKKAKIP